MLRPIELQGLEFPIKIAEDGEYLIEYSNLRTIFPLGKLSDEDINEVVVSRGITLMPVSLLSDFLYEAAMAGDTRAMLLLKSAANTTFVGLIDAALGKDFDVTRRFEFEVARRRSKFCRRNLTDAIKLFCLENANVIDAKTGKPLISPKFEKTVYFNTTNAIYRRMYGLDHKKLCQVLKLNPNKTNLRDYLSLEELAAIEKAEYEVAKYMLENRVRPAEALKHITIEQRSIDNIKLNIIEGA